MKTHTQSVFKAGVVLFIAALFLGTTVSAVQDTPRLAATPMKMDAVKPADEVELKYYGDIANSVGLQGGTPPYIWKSAIRLTQDELHAYMTWTLTTVVAAFDAGNGQEEMDAKIIVYNGSTATRPGSIITQQLCHFNTSDYQIVTLDSPVPLAGHNELWIAFEWTQTVEGAYVAPIDAGPHVPSKGDFCNLGSGWQSLYTASGGAIDGNWVIGGIVSGAGNAELQILNVKGPIGIKADIKNNKADVDASNVAWTMTISGKSINKTADGLITTIAGGAVAGISTGMIFGFGKVTIKITATADNAESVTITKNAFVLLFLVVGIK
jgi:hypothetical protein